MKLLVLGTGISPICIGPSKIISVDITTSKSGPEIFLFIPFSNNIIIRPFTSFAPVVYSMHGVLNRLRVQVRVFV